MMQFTESPLPPPPPLHHQVIIPPPSYPNRSLPIMNRDQQPPQRARDSRPWPGFPTPKAMNSFGDANCMEQLLVHCANAIESNDATLTQQILWVLNNIAPPDGDSNQRLTCAFLRALIARAAKSGTCKLIQAMANAHCNELSVQTHKFSVIELASFVDLTPWYRFGFTAANAAIVEVIEGFSIVHVVDLSLTHCMQIPTLVDAIANRFEVPPLLKLTVATADDHVPPRLDLSYDELGSKLVNFARSRNIVMEFRVMGSSYSDGFASLIDELRVQQHMMYGESGSSEALVINCHMALHYIPEETVLLGTNITSFAFENMQPPSLRTMFVKSIRSLEPKMVIVVDEDADFTSDNVVCRLRSAFNYLWIPFDTLDTFLPKGSNPREWYEANICWKIQNVVAHEGLQRVERLESKSRWVQRFRAAGFRGVSFTEDAVSEVKGMLDEHAAGWGLKKEEEQHLLLTWKGHNVVFATAWIPN